MENMILRLPVSLEPDVAIAIRKYLGTVPADQVGLANIVGLENSIQRAVDNQIKKDKEAEEKNKGGKEPKK